jgi:hypothetical protein
MAANDYSRRSNKDVFWGDDNNKSKSNELDELIKDEITLEEDTENNASEPICEPVTEETELKKKDIVLCKVKGHYYLHLIHSIKPNKKGSHSYLIGNNHGHMNGWVGRSQIFGIVREIL